MREFGEFVWLAALVVVCTAFGARAAEPHVALDIGQQAPDLTLPDQFGYEAKLSSLWEETPVVVFFYPKDFTPYCTMEAIGFRDARGELEELGLTVVGISIDTVGSHLRFAQAYDLKYSLLADVHARAAEKFQVRDSHQGFVLSRRATFLIDRGGEIAWVWDPVDPTEHATDVIAEAKRLQVVGAEKP